jgi:protein-S-isoprenylcysteine O-methyltransferase Ste14
MKEKDTSPDKYKHIKAIILLPFMVTIIIPFIIYILSKDESVIPINKLPLVLCFVVGCVVLILGLTLFTTSVILLAKIGQGTLAPWNPTKNIVVKGLYRYVRNPMIVGVNLVLLGESFLLQSGNILLWNLFFIIMNHFYFILKEEPDLHKRFGKEYKEYCTNVPRWIPRINGWRPEEE